MTLLSLSFKKRGWASAEFSLDDTILDVVEVDMNAKILILSFILFDFFGSD
jgi:hypothetical protein